MGVFDNLRRLVGGGNADGLALAQTRGNVSPMGFEALLNSVISQGGQMAMHAGTVKDIMDSQRNDAVLSGPLASAGLNKARASSGFVGINDYGIKGRRQYAAERRRLLDLYSIVMNNGDIRTAVTHLKNEIFRRGLEWEPAFEFKCRECGSEYTTKQARRLKYRCDCKDGELGEGTGPTGGSVGQWADLTEPPDDGRDDEDDQGPDGKGRFRRRPASTDAPRLVRPNKAEILRYEKLTNHCNYFGQSFENVLRMCEEDLNVVDDAFLFLCKMYEMSDLEIEAIADGADQHVPDSEVLQIFRLDPTLVEFDMDDRGIPGQAHHVCVFHRDQLLDVPPGQGWEFEWHGECPVDGLRTYPVYYKYVEQLANAYTVGRPETLYLMEDEVIHWSRYSPTETYGYPPVLSIYEKAMTLIGMDRYLYDYFYERKVPQGVVTVVTDDTASFNATKADVEARMAQDPHYIPWMAIASKTGQGKMEFVRFAYSLDELDYLPVRDEIRERIAGIYGVSQIWMQSTEGIGGLNNESQQLTVMSRVVEGAQRSYHTDVFPKFQRAMRIEDWNLRVRTPEESSELVALQIMQARAGVAQTMAAMGFGVEYDSDSEEFAFSGRVLSAEDQEKAGMDAADPFQASQPKPNFGGAGPKNREGDPRGQTAPRTPGGAGQGSKRMAPAKPTPPVTMPDPYDHKNGG